MNLFIILMLIISDILLLVLIMILDRKIDNNTHAIKYLFTEKDK